MLLTKPRFSVLVIAQLCLVQMGTLHAAVNNDKRPTTFLGAGLALGYAAPLSPVTAYSIQAEGSEKNIRADLTLGWQINAMNRIKVTGEYLDQYINYAFISGTTQEWVQQGAVGLDFQHDLSVYLNPQIDFSLYYSHAPTRTLTPVTYSTISVLGLTITDTNIRRLAGSNAGGASLGASVHPWCGAEVGAAINYDDVHYNVVNVRPSFVNGIGFGGTAFYNQLLTDHITLGLLGSVRQPFNNYQATLDYRQGPWDFGLFSEYTRGQDELPNTWYAGLTVNYAADCLPPVRVIDYKHEVGAREFCLNGAYPYAVVTSPASPPVLLKNRPAELGPKLPIVRSTHA